MSNSEICVLITGVGGGSLGRELIKAFKLSAQKYKIVATDMSPRSVGLFETSYRYIIPPSSSPQYLESLLKICKDEGVQAITPGSEPEIEQIAKNSKFFEDHGIKVLLNSWDVIKKCQDKFELMNFLNSKGILCPKYFLYNQDSDLDKITSYPVVVKPKSGSGSQNVFLAQDREEVSFFCNYLIKYGLLPTVQEYVGDADGEFTIGILYADNGKLLTSIAMRRILSGGLSTRQTVFNPKNNKKYVISSGISQGLIEDFREIRTMGEQMAAIINSNGPINIQCRKTDRGIIPFEINPRFSGTTGSRSLVGHNEPDIFCRYRLYDEIPKETNHKYGYVLRDIIEKFFTINELESIRKA